MTCLIKGLVLAGCLGLLAACQGSGWKPSPQQLSEAEIAAHLQQVEAADSIEDPEARCLAYPDLRNMRWPAGVVAARCAMQRSPRYSAAELSSKLASPEGRAEVSQSFDALLDAHYSDSGQREQIFLAIEPFKSHQSLGEFVAQWVRDEPENHWAQLAQGARLKGAAQDSRGTGYIRETPEADLRAASERARQAIPYLERALVLEPRLSPACVVQIEAMRLAGGMPARHVADRCREIDPVSYHVVMAWWPLAETAEVEAHIARYGKQNALLPGIRTVIAGRHFDTLPQGAMPNAIEPMLDALRHGPNARMLNAVSAGFNELGRPDLGMMFLSQAVRFDMGYSHYRFIRAFQNQVARPAWAVVDFERLLEVHPGQPDYVRMLRELRGELEKAERASRPPTAEELELAEFVRACGKFAYKVLWASDDELAVDPMKDCGDEVIERWPGEAEAWRVRADVLHQHKRPGFEEAARKYLEIATPGSPDYYSHEARFKRLLGE